MAALSLVSFVVSAQYTVGGSATSSGGGCYQLTTTSPGNQKGYVYSNVKIDLNDTIDLKFTVNLGSNNAGADGICFVLRDDISSALIGNLAGGSLGFGTPGNNPPGGSVGIEIDTYFNGGGTTNDPPSQADHIGIQKNWSINHLGPDVLASPVSALPGNANIEDGANHVFDVKWNPSTQVLKVYIDCGERISYTGNLVDSIFNGNNLVHWGFLGATGGAQNNQSFCLGDPITNFINPLNTFYDICKGDTVELDAGTSTINYLWSPATALSSTTVRNPKAYPVDTTTYIVRQTYQCDTVYDTATVRVIPPNFTTSGVITNASCKDMCNGAVNLSVNGGTGQYKYKWSTTATTQDVNSLCDGQYIVTVQDTLPSSPNYLCRVKDTFYITEPLELEADIINPTKTKCPKSNACNAKATAIGTGGTFPYYYYWSTGSYIQSPTNLCKGWNFVTIADSKGCTAKDSVKILSPDTIVTTGFGDTLICIGKVAAIASASTGGTPPFSFVWHEGSIAGPIISLSSNEAVTPAVTTQYFVQSFDANGCLGDTSEVLVKVRPPLDVEFIAPDTICPYDTVDITAVGIGGDSNYTFAWEAGFFGETISVSPDQSASYRVTVSDFCGTPFFSDSVFIQVGGYPQLVPHIEVEDDSVCRSENSIYMIASSRGGFHGPEEYIFTWLYNNSHSKYQFVDPEVTKSYVVKVEDLCLSPVGYDTVTIYVGDSVSPELEIFPILACKEADVTIRLNNYDPDYTYNWYLDTFDYLLDYKFDSTVYRFNKPGCFNFKLTVTTDFGCYSERDWDCAIRVKESPKVAMDWYPMFPSNVHPLVTFKDISTPHVKNYWVIERDTFYNLDDFQYEFYERDEPFDVNLFVINSEGCIDSITQPILYQEQTLIHIPNSFTPNGDGINDEFFIEGEGFQQEGFDLSIFDRWGQQVFRTTRSTQGWDGRNENYGLVPVGVYFMRLAYRDQSNIERVIYQQIYVGVTGDRSSVK